MDFILHMYILMCLAMICLYVIVMTDIYSKSNVICLAPPFPQATPDNNAFEWGNTSLYQMRIKNTQEQIYL